MKARLLRQSLCLLIVLVFIPHSAYAENARLTNIIVTNTRDDLLLYLTVEGAFHEEMQSAILSGVPATFSFFISLNRSRNFWLDKNIADIKVTHTVKYDTLKNEFIVKRSWEDNKPLVVKSIADAQKLMVEVDSLKIIGLERLEKGRHYQIRAKAELSKLTLPFYLHYVLFFVSLWDFETDWYTIDFIY